MDEKDYLMALKDVLKRKYSLSGEDAADMILSSYIISLIVLYPEETLHDDIEVHADNIYEDHQVSKKKKNKNRTVIVRGRVRGNDILYKSIL